MPASLFTAPVAFPVNLALVKQALQIAPDATDEDTLLASVILPTAVQRAQIATRRAFITQTWDWTIDRFPPREPFIELPWPPLQEVVSITYLDPQLVWQTWPADEYRVEPFTGPTCARGRIVLPFGGVWPVPVSQPGCIAIRFIAGYGDDGSTVPPALIASMLADAGTLYEESVRRSMVTGQRAAAITFPPRTPSATSFYWMFRSEATQRDPLEGDE
jgi:uncharacterized phiE125 gp8 family phage protein